MSENNALKRPRQLWTAIVVLYVQGVLNVLSGVLLVYLAGVEADHGREAPEMSLLGYASVVLAIVLIGSAVQLTRGVWWVRYPVAVIEALSIISGVIAIFSGAITAVGGVALGILVLVNLFHSDVRLWFDPVFPVVPVVPQSATTDEWVEGRVARVMATSRAAGDPPLDDAQRATVARLVQLGPSALGAARGAVRSIGKELHRAGGVPLMRAVLHEAEVASLRQNSVSILREVEMAWDNIGEWMG